MNHKQTKPEVPRARLVLHTDPASLSERHLAMLLALLGKAWHLARVLPGKPVESVHVSVQMEGRAACGHAQSAAIAEQQAEPHRLLCPGGTGTRRVFLAEDPHAEHAQSEARKP